MFPTTVRRGLSATRASLRKAADSSASSSSSSPTASPVLSRVAEDAQSQAPAASQQTSPRPNRAFHSSSRSSASLTSIPSAPLDADPDTIVPPFYVQFKLQRDAIVERKELDDELMSLLSAGLLSDDIAATTRRYPHKVPTEHTTPSGEIVHPSGFVVPTPGEARPRRADLRARDSRVQTQGVAERVNEEDLVGIAAQLRSRREKIPFEVVDLDGTVRHPSGFTPPTPAHEFSRRLSLIGLAKAPTPRRDVKRL